MDPAVIIKNEIGILAVADEMEIRTFLVDFHWRSDKQLSGSFRNRRNSTHKFVSIFFAVHTSFIDWAIEIVHAIQPAVHIHQPCGQLAIGIGRKWWKQGFRHWLFWKSPLIAERNNYCK